MQERLQFYIDGQWVDPIEARPFDVIDPSTEEPIARIALGSAKDVDRAAVAARKAFETFSRTTREQRLELLQSIVGAYQKRYDELAETISREMGAPLWLARAAQAATGLGHLTQAIEVLERYEFETLRGTTLIRREPVGVCGFITPWNWPLNQIMCKVAPALAAGCTMVLKPTEVAPLNALLLAEILDEAGVPAGVFNLVNGDGPTVGQAISSHPEIDMVSFTGSTRAGIQVAIAAAPTVKRVTQELGGKSANVILDDADFATAVGGGVMGCAMNSGQSCNAPTRMLVPRSRHDEAVAIAKAAVEGITVGDPFAEGTRLGPVVSEAQWKKIQGLIERGIDEGATLVVGGPGRPEGLDRGYYVRPTVFADVSNDMTIAREEIFGPVLSILPYDDEEQAIEIANDTNYGLAGYVSSGDLERARRVARRIRAGLIALNGAQPDFSAPFGGYKQSGNGREWGELGFEEFLEVKAIMGWQQG
ncbi:MAG TPA: aldehyde dehydrogenase family protein [Alphaproteobacteria bacterium]|nr:aldehyde dehydrogenase family protein [Alphaproteobacteria bacterium]